MDVPILWSDWLSLLNQLGNVLNSELGQPRTRPTNARHASCPASVRMRCSWPPSPPPGPVIHTRSPCRRSPPRVSYPVRHASTSRPRTGYSGRVHSPGQERHTSHVEVPWTLACYPAGGRDVCCFEEFFLDLSIGGKTKVTGGKLSKSVCIS